MTNIMGRVKFTGRHTNRPNPKPKP